MLKSPFSTRPVIEALEARIAPATFTVTTTADSGPGSLRQAILDANALTGADAIGFNIEGDQPQVIALTSPLPAITEQLTLSVLSVDKWRNEIIRNEIVRIDGTGAGADAVGLKVTASNCLIGGLEIANFSGSGLVIEGGSSNVVLYNSIFSNADHGIHIRGGGSNRVFANVIGASANLPGSTGNKGDGVLLENSTASLISPPSNGTPVGMEMPPYLIPSGNTISANGLWGIEVRNSDSTILANNSIKENGAQATSLDQGGGIAVFDSKNVSIGTVLSARASPFGTTYDHMEKRVYGNSVSANTGHGILISGQQSSGTILAGNTITSNLSGDGVHIDGAANTQFGLSYYDSYIYDSTTYASASGWKMVGNTISQSANWGVAAVNNASNITVKGNTFSANALGAVLFDHISGATIGGLEMYKWVSGVTHFTTTTSDTNKIDLDSRTGVVVKGSTGVEITSNAFTGSGVPIDLGGDGPTTNDSGDTDAGANHLQNYPTLVFANNQVTESLATDAANAKFRIQIFKFDPTTGYSLFSTQEVTTDADGRSVSTLGSVSITAGQQLFATATNLALGETSEMSTAAVVWPRVSINPATTSEGNSGVQNVSFTVSLEASTTVPVKVGYRSADSTAKAGEDYGAVEGMLVFEPGETTKTITVPVFGDPIKEATESFFVQLTSAENGVLSPTNSSVAGTILNDDGLPTISIHDVLTAEGANTSATRPGYTEVQYTLTLSQSSFDPVTVKLGVVGGTASVSSDFDPVDSTITFAPGATSVTKTIYIKNDTAREETETIQLQLSNPTACTLGNANATVSILDDDTWVIQADAVQIAEGNDGQSVAVMKVRLVNSYGVTDHTHPISIDFTTQNGTAAAGSDYVASQGTLTFQPGEIEKTISVPILGDSTAELNENFSVKFSSAFGAALQQASQTVSLLNDDPGTISVASASITEGHSGQKMLVFNVSMSVPTTSPVSVNFETQDGTALAGVDFEAVTGQISFAPGETQKTISVPILGDRVAEQNETFTLKLSEATGGATITTAAATGTILNDDPLISIESAQFMEGQPGTSGTRSVYLPVRLSQATDIPISVDFTTSNGSAEAPSDYNATSGTLTFAAGQTLQYIELQLVGDETFEPDETFSVKLSNPQGAQIGTDTGVVTIKSDEAFISAQDVTIAEGHSGTKSLVFTVTLSQAQSSAVTVDYTTADGTATAGSDYTAALGTLSFAPGETTKVISVPVLGDTAQEGDEIVKLLLSNAAGVSVATPEVHGTIANDDSPESLPVLSVANADVAEGHFGSSSLVFTFSLSKASTSPVSVQYTTADGTATAGSDYTAVSGTLTFAPGETTKVVSVPVLGDTAQEGDEIVKLLFSNAVGVNLATPEVHGTIANDDSPESLPVLSVANADVAEGHFGSSSLVFTFSLSKASTSPVSVQYTTADGTATAGSDYTAALGTLTFAPGETTKTVSLAISGDEQVESNETLRLLLSGVTEATLSATEATGFILDDDSSPPTVLPALSVQGGSVYEGYTGTTKSLPFTVTLSEASAWPVSVHYFTGGLTAYGGHDYLESSGLLTFAPGETTKTIDVPVFGDENWEENDTVRLYLSSPTGATIATSQATGTILNDDLSAYDVGLRVSKLGNGKYKAIWSENDGDLVTLISNQKIGYLFGYDAEGHTVVQKVSTIGDKPSSLQFSVQKSLTGDGKVNVDQIWTNADLTEVTIPGRLGSIVAGDTKLKTPGIHKLTVDSFGLDSASVEAGAEPLQSKVRGSIGSFAVKGDFIGANLSISGGSFGSLTIGGNLEGTSSGTSTGLYVEKGLNKLQVDGDIRGTDSAHPVVIRTAGFPDHPTETLHRVVIGGDVVNTNLLAGTSSQVGVRVGEVLVKGDWTASNLIVGAGAGTDGLFGTEDDMAMQNAASRIARITIQGAVSGTAAAENGSDHFGFVAGRIAAFQAGAQKLELSSKWKDSMEVGSTFDMMLRELAGRSRS